MHDPTPGHPSRRDFLAGTASAAILASTGHAASLARTARGAPALGDRPLRIGLVGCGGRGSGAVDDALAADPNASLVAVGDAFADRVDGALRNLSADHQDRIAVDEDHRFVGFDAFRHVVDSDVDLVVLATPPHFRPEHFAYAVEKGRHVFLEKPVAVDGHGVMRVLAAADVADAKSLKVGVGLQRRHQEGYVEAMARVHAGAIGDIVAARCYWNQGGLWHADRQHGWSDMEWQLRNWLYFTWLSGDHIVEQHIHNIDVVNWAMRTHPVRAIGMGGRQVRTDPRFGHVFDHHAVQFEYPNGAFLFSQCRQIDNCWNAVSEHLMGTKGKADLNARSWSIEGAESWEHDRRRDHSPYRTEHVDLIAAIRQGTAHNEARLGAESTLTAVMGRMATYTGREVTWDEALAGERLGPVEYAWGDLPFPEVAMPGRA